MPAIEVVAKLINGKKNVECLKKGLSESCINEDKIEVAKKALKEQWDLSYNIGEEKRRNV